MPPKKRVRDNDSPGGDAAVDAQSIVKADYLKNASPGQVLARLLEVANALERVTAGTTEGVALVTKLFVEEVTKSEYINHPSADVQCVVGIVIAECLRIKSELEFGKRSNEVLNLMTAVLGGKAAGNKKGGAANATSDALQRRHLIEALSKGNGLETLVKHAKGNVVEDLVASITDRLLFSGEAVDDSQVANCATVISQTITAHHSISTVQFNFLLAASGAPPKGMTPCASQVSKATAAAVFRKSEDVFHELISDYVNHGLHDAVEELRKFDIADGDASEKRQAMLDLGRIVEAIPAVASISSNLGFRLFPEASRYLSEENYEVRHAVVKAFAGAFLVNPKLRTEYSPLYHNLLSRVTDARPTIRSFMVRYLTQLAQQFNPQSADSAWAEIANQISGRLVDGDENIRRQAIEATCELAAVAPLKFLKANPTGGELALRCADKKLGVRRVAIDQLTTLFLKFRQVETLKSLVQAQANISWIPNAIMVGTKLEGTVQYIEASLERMMSIRASAKANSSAASPGTKGGKKGGAAGRSASKPVRGAKNVAVFDFEEELNADSTTDGGSTFDDINTNVPCALSFLCEQLNKDNLNTLVMLAEKKAQLRGVVLKLLALRDMIKTVDVESSEGQVVVSNIKRLIAFLGQVTHNVEVWNNLFKLKDAKPIKALAALCAEDCTDYVKATQDCLTTFKGRVEDKTYRFVEENLIIRLTFPVSQQDTHDLVTIIEAKRKTAGSRFLGYLRALRAIAGTASHYVSPHVVTIVGWIGVDATNASANEKDDKQYQHFISQFNEELNVLSLVNPEHSKISDAQKKTVIETIGRICIQNTSGSAAKTAARCLCKLFKKETKPFVGLMKNINGALNAAAHETANNLASTVVSHMRTVQVFLKDAPQGAKKDFAGLVAPIMESIETILLLTVGASTAQDDLPAKHKAIKHAGGLLKYKSALCEVVAVSAKVITTHAKTCAAAHRSAIVDNAFTTLTSAYRKTKEIAAGSEAVGPTLRRLAIAKQLVQLLVLENLGGSDISLGVCSMIFVTSETNPDVRAEVQRKLENHIRKKGAGTAILALLVLTSFAEETRGGYNGLKGLVHSAAEEMRSRIGDIKVDDVNATGVYMEFAVPYLISFMSHHPWHDDEAENNFASFQRVFILFFEELFRHDNNAASFMQAMLHRLKTHNDALNVQSTNTRAMADLAYKIMWDILSQKSISLDQVKSFPGSVLIPQQLFRHDKGGQFTSDRVYLAKNITLIHQPQFKLAVGLTPGKSLARSGAPSLSPGAVSFEPEELSPPTRRARKEESPPNTGLAAVAGGKFKTPARTTQSPPTSGRKSTGQKKKGQDTEQVVIETIAALTDGLTASQIGKLSWKVTQGKIKEALGLPATGALSDEIRAMASAAVADAVKAVNDDSDDE